MNTRSILKDQNEPSFLEYQEQYEENGAWYTLAANFVLGKNESVHTDQFVIIDDKTGKDISINTLMSPALNWILLDFNKRVLNHIQFYKHEIAEHFEQADADARREAQFCAYRDSRTA